MSETDGTAPTTGQLEGRIDTIETKLDSILDKLGSGERTAHDTAQVHTERRLDRPTTVADEVREQLAERDRAKADATTRQGEADRLAAVEASVREMAEQPPESPVRRVERFMRWR